MKGSYDATIGPKLMVMRIIILALFMGATSFTGVASMMHFTKEPPINPPAAPGAPAAAAAPQNDKTPIVGFMGVFMLTVAVVARFIVPQLMTPNLPPPGSLFQGDAAVEESIVVERLLAHYQTQLIVLAAMAEGATFMLLVSLMSFDTTWALPAAIFGLLWILSYFPIHDGLMSWLDDQVMQWQATK